MQLNFKKGLSMLNSIGEPAQVWHVAVIFALVIFIAMNVRYRFDKLERLIKEKTYEHGKDR